MYEQNAKMAAMAQSIGGQIGVAQTAPATIGNAIANPQPMAEVVNALGNAEALAARLLQRVSTLIGGNPMPESAQSPGQATNPPALLALGARANYVNGVIDLAHNALSRLEAHL